MNYLKELIDAVTQFYKRWFSKVCCFKSECTCLLRCCPQRLLYYYLEYGGIVFYSRFLSRVVNWRVAYRVCCCCLLLLMRLLGLFVYAHPHYSARALCAFNILR